MKIVFIISIFLQVLLPVKKEKVTIITSPNSSVRIKFGMEKLTNSLSKAGYEVQCLNKPIKAGQGKLILVGEANDSLFNVDLHKLGINFNQVPGKEGYSIKSFKNLIAVKGTDASGTLYGCLTLTDSVNTYGRLPQNINITDQPQMVMRGSCIGLQKPYYLPGRTVYEYPYTPETFPWFYDKALWIKYLDMMVENRMNSLYLWNGHPFASLVKLKDYPYAVEVDDSTFKKNEEIYHFLTEEANKRGIWVIQMFYNIIVSKPFAEKNGLKTQDRSRPIIPLIADYTRKSIAAFIEKYPNVGLLITLGEAMNTDEDDVKWLTETIIPGVKDGLKALGRTDEPPIILRAHDTNAQMDIDAALPLYKNMYTMHKYNGESLTTYQPQGPWSEIHKNLSKLGSVHIENVHILANLEPFRYGSPAFIQKSVQAMHTVHGANGLHLYPQASYWDWPYSADKTSPRLLEMDRDWIWYQAWSRYSWDCNRDTTSENDFWTKKLGNYYGCGQYGENIMQAYNQAGEIAPKLLRRFGITDGNRETLSLGLFMSQLVNPKKWRIYPDFYKSNGPTGEILIEYAEREWKKEPHTGETPPQIISEVVQHGNLAVAAIEKAGSHVTANKEEFARLKNDMYCEQAMADFFSEKVKAAMLVLRYSYSKDISDLDKALPYLEKSIAYYKQLVNLTKDSYLYANSMQTKQRRIPIGGNDGKNKTWAELLPYYEDELANFKKNLQMLKTGAPVQTTNTALIPAKVKILDKDLKFVPFQKNQKLFSDQDFRIKDFAEELKDLSFIRLSMANLEKEPLNLHFINNRPVNVIVGYFSTDDKDYMKPPTLETNASANDRGQAEVKIANALAIENMPPVNIHTYYFEAGPNVLPLDKGIGLILGFTDASQKIISRDAGLEEKEGIDWLFN
ncbi:MAG: hypothetical protein Q8907_10810 [Bacteroidota bacterium]|nr:hypothetical protein [Bacteroidota bacterium]